MKYIEKHPSLISIVNNGVQNEYYCKICSQKILEIKLQTNTTFDEYTNSQNDYINDHNRSINNIINRTIYQFFTHYCKVSAKLNRFTTYDQIFALVSNITKDKYNDLAIKYNPQTLASSIDTTKL
jgi:hypothetical protein